MKNIFWDGVLLILCVAIYLILGFELRQRKIKTHWILLLGWINFILVSWLINFAFIGVVSTLSLFGGNLLPEFLEWRESK